MRVPRGGLGLDALVDLQADSNNPVEDWTTESRFSGFLADNPFDGGHGDPQLRRVQSAGRRPNSDLQRSRGTNPHEVQTVGIRGSYALPEGGDPVIAEPTPGDLVSAAGDWVVDDGHGDPSQYSLELHEARIIAKTHKVDDKRFYLLVNSFFTRGTRQERRARSRYSGAESNWLWCSDVRGGEGHAQRNSSRAGHRRAPGVRVKSITGNANPGSPFGFCRVVVENDGTGPITDFQCHGDASDPSNAACRDPSPVFGPKYTQIAWPARSGQPGTTLETYGSAAATVTIRPQQTQ